MGVSLAVPKSRRTASKQTHRHQAVERRIAQLEKDVQTLAKIADKLRKTILNVSRNVEVVNANSNAITKHYLNFLATAGLVDQTDELKALLKDL